VRLARGAVEVSGPPPAAPRTRGRSRGHWSARGRSQRGCRLDNACEGLDRPRLHRPFARGAPSFWLAQVP